MTVEEPPTSENIAKNYAWCTYEKPGAYLCIEVAACVVCEGTADSVRIGVMVG